MDIPPDSQSLMSSPQGKALTPVHYEQALAILTSFESIMPMVQVFDMYGYTPAEEIGLLIDMVRTAEKDGDRLKALKQLQQRRAEILTNSGVLVKATKTNINSDGSQTTLSGALVTNLLNPDKRNIKDEKPEADTQTPAKDDPRYSEYGEDDDIEEYHPTRPAGTGRDPGPAGNVGGGDTESLSVCDDYDAPEIPCTVNKRPVDASTRRGIAGYGGQ